MALADSKQAIGAVTEALKNQLVARTGVTTVDVGRPEAAAASSNGPKLNLFLYQVDVDGHLRSHTLDEGQPAPLWMVLHYLLTAFDEGKESDSINAQRLLGEGMLALHEMNFLQPTASALGDNPEPLKITFDTADTTLLSKIMQGGDEKYRLAAAFQVRPIMLVPATTPHYVLPVKTVGPSGDEGVAVMPALGPRLLTIRPEKFALGAEVTITGRDVGGDIEEVQLGSFSYPVTAARDGEVRTVITARPGLSAGSYPVRVMRRLRGDQKVASDTLLAHLLPTLTAASHGALSIKDGKRYGDLDLSGNLLGSPDDNIFVGFYRNGSVALVLQGAGTAAQTDMTVTVDSDHALSPGSYRIILRVNGEQASNAPEVDWS